MKAETFALTILVNLLALFIVASIIYFVNDLFKIGLKPAECLSIGETIILFLLYPSVFAAVRRPAKNG